MHAVEYCIKAAEVLCGWTLLQLYGSAFHQETFLSLQCKYMHAFFKLHTIVNSLYSVILYYIVYVYTIEYIRH